MTKKSIRFFNDREVRAVCTYSDNTIDGQSRKKTYTLFESGLYYLSAMRDSVADGTHIKQLIDGALTDKINDRETFMKGIDYSYYYEEE